MAYDNTCKYIASQNPASFVRWLLPNEKFTKVEILKTELPAEPIRADSLILLQFGNTILHLEFEKLPYSDPPIPERMLNYWVRLYGKYRCRIEQVVIFLEPTNSPLVFINRFEEANTIHSYRIMRLWEEESELFLGEPTLLPLAPLTRSNSPIELLQEVSQRIKLIEDPTQRKEILACTALMAGLLYKPNLISQLFREDNMEESSFYKHIIEKGVQRGLQQGLQQGLEQGQKQHALLQTLRLLRRRVGEIPVSTEDRICILSLSQLEELAEALLDFTSPADLTTWLQNLK
ncbi:Rpn family recombination-promoting nuclease/putative transposase [Floridanema evergladense]|uniref:Rpn family recombination-promoting nuclease/putative transposase n=1 Tax=Floridaenema evergladense BLCC-F167 TaxID=3153639 RepID=A0ABV4WGU4_9CYAN